MHGTELIARLTQWQHIRSKDVWLVGILDEKLDDFNRKVFSPQIDGSKASLELPGILDQVISMVVLKADDGTPYRAFVCQHPARALRGLVAVVISAAGAHDDLGVKPLAGRVQAQLKRLKPAFPIAVWSQVIGERPATFACEPGLRRPRTSAIGPRLRLAGDYLDPNLPATIEAAVASGEAAGRAVAHSLAG